MRALLIRTGLLGAAVAAVGATDARAQDDARPEKRPDIFRNR